MNTNQISSPFSAENIFGIEKDYRLARVSKISLFMHGAGEGNIIFGDGLENYPDKNIKQNSFDILVANPPYSVSAFKPHLKLKNNKFSILDSISNSGSEIETLFVERIAQLLKPNGVAAVILPSSILNKENESFVAAREKILKNFKLKAIVLFGSKTFGATGTNTVVLFIEKYNEPPKRVDLIEDGVDAIFEQADLDGWEDKIIINQYLKKINVTEKIYDDFINEKIDINKISDKYFLKYRESFLSLSTTVAKQKQKTFKKMSECDKNSWLTKQYYQYAKSIEREKLKFFSLIYNQRTLIVVSPDDNKEQEKFLGYKWSNRKGQEGIQIINEGGKLYDSKNRISDNKVSSLIRNIFSNEEKCIEDIDKYYYLNTKDMLDFGRVDFNKGINTNKPVTVVNWGGAKTDKIENLFKLQLGKTPNRDNINYWKDGTNKWISISDMKNMENDESFETKEKITDLAITNTKIKLVPKNTVIMSFKLTIGRTLITQEDIYTNEAIMAFLPISDKISNDFLKIFLENNLWNDNTMNAVKGKTLNKETIGNTQIPLLSKEEQVKIVNEFKTITEKIKEKEMLLKKHDDSIKSKFVEMFGDINIDYNKWGYKKLHDICDVRDGTHESPKYVKEGFPLLTSQNFTNGFVDFSNANYISKDDFDSINIRSKVDVGDIVMPMIGTIGSPVIVDTSEEFAIKNVALIKFKDSKFKAEYVKQILDSDYLENVVANSNRGSNRKFISLGDIRNINILDAPIHLQDEFASYVKEIDKLKFECIRQKEQLQIDKENLIDKYFR